jgi:hypothetical protein
MTIGNLARIAFAAIIGPIQAAFNWEVTLLFFVAFLILTLILLQFFNLNHQVKSIVDLEKNDLESQGMLVTQMEV